MNSELEKLKKELELALQNPNIDMEELTQISCKIDEEIEKIYLNKEKGIEYDKNYKQFLDRADKELLINAISKDLIEQFKMNNLSKFNVNRTANGIYDFCCLTISGVSKADIAHFIARKGWYYYDLIPEEENKETLTANEKYQAIIKSLQDKYVELLKNKME